MKPIAGALCGGCGLAKVNPSLMEYPGNPLLRLSLQDFLDLQFSQTEYLEHMERSIFKQVLTLS